MRLTIRTLRLVPLLALLILAVSLSAVREARAQGVSGAFVAAPIFDAGGTALAVFAGGSVAQLEAAAGAVGATGVWAQDRSGTYRLLVVNGPAFLKAPFTEAFPAGFTGASAMTVVRPVGAAAPAAVPAPAATAAPTATALPAGGMSAYESAIARQAFDGTNVQRAANALGQLRRVAILDASAAAYARVVFERDPYLSSVADAHSLDGQPWDRATRAGYAWAAFAENVATMSATTQPADAQVAPLMVDGWMKSPPHRANILTGSYTDTGVGCHAGRPASPKPGLDFAIICVAVYGTPK